MRTSGGGVPTGLDDLKGLLQLHDAVRHRPCLCCSWHSRGAGGLEQTCVKTTEFCLFVCFKLIPKKVT